MGMTNREAALASALCELTAMVRGECPQLLNEDSGGNSRLSIEIDELLEEPTIGAGHAERLAAEGLRVNGVWTDAGVKEMLK